MKIHIVRVKRLGYNEAAHARGRNRRARSESTIEFASFTVIMIMALLAMLVYVKRALQGGYRKTYDEIGEQYDPASTTGKHDIKTEAEKTDGFHNGVWTFPDNTQKRSMTGKESVGDYDATLWPW